jgi:hypothetical protein
MMVRTMESPLDFVTAVAIQQTCWMILRAGREMSSSAMTEWGRDAIARNRENLDSAKCDNT